MISSEYFERMKEIERLDIPNKVVDAETESIFKVNLNTRKITVPPEFRDVFAVQGDHKAETIWFAVDRWFDGVDLNSKTAGIQFENAEEIGLRGFDYISLQGDDGDEDQSKGDLPVLMLGWEIPYDVTQKAGDVELSIRFWETKDIDLTYNLTTQPFKAYIKPALQVGEALLEDVENKREQLNPPADSLSTLVEKIEKIYQNDELRLVDYEKISNKPSINGTELKGKLFTNKQKAIDNTASVNDNYTYHYVAVSYNDLNDIPMINGIPLIGDKKDSDLGIKVDVDEVLSTTSVNPVQNQAITTKVNSLQQSIDELWEEMDGMTFIPLSISSFECEPKLAEIGSTINTVDFTWTLGGTPTVLKINNTDIALGTSQITLSDLGLEEDKEFTLYAEDRKANNVSATTQLLFVNKVFHGVQEIPSEYNTSFINRLIGQLQTGKEGVIDVVANENQYIYYALPKSYGDCVFTSGGFSGGFTKIDTISYTNDYGVATDYDIWKSDNANLGQTNIIIS